MLSRADFEGKVQAHLDMMYRTALRMTGQAASAEDLVQEACMRAWANLHRFQDGTNFRAWIMTIMTNSFINDYRRRSKAPVLTDFSEVEPASPRQPEYLTAKEVDALKERVGDSAKRALEKLPDEFRIVFLLSSIEDMSYKEISKVLGIPIGTVMSRLFRARQVLRTELAAEARAAGVRVGEELS